MSLFTWFVEYYPDIPGEDTNGLWSPRTASFNWCEVDYEVTYYVAEFWNTLTSILFIVCSFHLIYQYKKTENDIRSLYFVDVKKQWTHLITLFYFVSFGVLGTATIAYHVSLKWYVQKLDQVSELSTVAALLFVFMLRSYTTSDRTPPPLSVYKVIAAWSYLILSFFIIFYYREYYDALLEFTIVFILIRIQYISSTYPDYEWLQTMMLHKVVILLVFAVSAWFIDQIYCDVILSQYPYFYGHALWHILVALAFHQSGMNLILLQIYITDKPEIVSHLQIHKFFTFIHGVSFKVIHG